MTLYNVYKAIIEYQPENTIGKPIQMRADVVLVADAQAALAEKDKRIAEIEVESAFLRDYRDRLIERVKEIGAERDRLREALDGSHLSDMDMGEIWDGIKDKQAPKEVV